MTAFEPATCRLHGEIRAIVLLGAFFLGGVLAVTVYLQSDSRDPDWSMVIIAGVLAAMFGAFTLHVWTLRYEVSKAGLTCCGLFSRKTIYWDQIKSAQVAQPSNDIRLEARDGTVIHVPVASLEGGWQLMSVLEETVGTISVQVIRGTPQMETLVRSLPYLAIGGGAAALLLAGVGGRSGLILAGCGGGAIDALVVFWEHRARARGKNVSSWPPGFMSVIVMMFLIDTHNSPFLPQLASVAAGALFSFSLVMFSFRKRILAYV